MISMLASTDLNTRNRQGFFRIVSWASANKVFRSSGRHVHKPWTVNRSSLGKWEFDTAKAAEYTLQLCQAIASSFMDVFKVIFSLKIQSNNMLQKW